MTEEKMSTFDKEFGFQDRLLAVDRKINEIDMRGAHWYIEIVSLLHGVNKVGTGLFYKFSQNEFTLKFFESAKERGVSDKGNAFMLLLKRSDIGSELYDSVGITNKHFEQITGLKALTGEEYFAKCESVSYFNDIGATLIHL